MVTKTQDDKDVLLKEQAVEIKELKKAVTALLNRVSHLEKRERSIEALIRRNAVDIRNVAVQNQNNAQMIQAIGSSRGR